MTSTLLPTLATKASVDNVIRKTEDVVLVLRFGRDQDLACMQLDEIVRYFGQIGILLTPFLWHSIYYIILNLISNMLWYINVKFPYPAPTSVPKIDQCCFLIVMSVGAYGVLKRS